MGIPANAREYRGIQGNTRLYWGIQGNTVEYNGIHSNKRECKGIQGKCGNKREYCIRVYRGNTGIQGEDGNKFNTGEYRGIQGNTRE